MNEDESKKILTEALNRFKELEDEEREERHEAVQDSRFVNVQGAQFGDSYTQYEADRPRLEIDRISPAIAQITGDYRQSRTQMKVRPVSGGASEDIAKIQNGLIRNIQVASGSEAIYNNAFDECITGGRGGWRIITKHTDDDVFEQDLMLSPINDAATSLWFGKCDSLDKRNAKYAFLITEMELEEFKAEFPDRQITDFNTTHFKHANCQSWRKGKIVRVAEYWVKEPIIKNIGLLSDGRTIDLSEEKKVLDELKASGVEVVKQRLVKSHKVVMYKMNGVEILSGAHEWAGKFIPLVPQYGKVTTIEGRTYVRGIVRKAKDPQRFYNYATNAALEAVALSTKEPYWVTEDQASGYDEQYAEYNVNNNPFMFYKSDPNAPGPPQRGGAPSVQAALIQQIQQAAGDIETATGIYAPALGNAPQLLSEKSVQSQAEKGDRGSFLYTDNADIAKKYTADILIDLFPRIYDTPRVIRILGLDGSSELVEINQEQLDEFNQPIVDKETGKTVIVNDLTSGKYDVVTETGPAFNTLKKESANQLIELAAASPTFEQVSTDLIAKNLGVLEGEELTKRVRKVMIQNGIVEPNEEEIEELGLNKPQPPDENAQALQDNVIMQTEKMQSEIELNDAKTQAELVKTQSQTIEALNELLLAMQKKTDMGLPLTADDRALVIQQGDIVEDAQNITQGEENPNSEQAEDLAKNLNQGELDIE
jgi:hypothetical protein